MKLNVSVPHVFAYGSDEVQPAAAHGQDVMDAAYNTVRNYPGGAAALAPRLGMSVSTLLHKTNPGVSTHHLAVQEAVVVQDFTQNFAILHAMADALGHVALRATPAQAAGDPLETLSRLYCEVADFTRAVTEALPAGANGVSPNQMRRANHHAQELLASIGHTLSMLRARMRPAPGEGA